MSKLSEEREDHLGHPWQELSPLQPPLLDPSTRPNDRPCARDGFFGVLTEEAPCVMIASFNNSLEFEKLVKMMLAFRINFILSYCCDRAPAGALPCLLIDEPRPCRARPHARCCVFHVCTAALESRVPSFSILSAISLCVSAQAQPLLRLCSGHALASLLYTNERGGETLPASACANPQASAPGVQALAGAARGFFVTVSPYLDRGWIAYHALSFLALPNPGRLRASRPNGRSMSLGKRSVPSAVDRAVVIGVPPV